MFTRFCFVCILSASLSFAHVLRIFSAESGRIVSVDTTVESVKIQRLFLCTSSLLISNWALYQPFKDAWWQEKRTNFHFYRGYKRKRGYWDFGWHDSLYGHMDKLGHFYSSKLLSERFTDLSKWIGFKSASSRWIGPVLSFLLMLEIEIYDSFFEEWGFSLADLSANALGAFSPLLSKQMKFMNRFQLKLSYKASDFVNDEELYVKDYVGMTFWLSYDINRDLPRKLEQYWPDFLNFAIGYSVDRPSNGNIELFIAPDINWEAFSSRQQGVRYQLLRALNYFHVPSFTLQLTPRKRFYPLYF